MKNSKIKQYLELLKEDIEMTIEQASEQVGIKLTTAKINLNKKVLSRLCEKWGWDINDFTRFFKK